MKFTHLASVMMLFSALAHGDIIQDLPKAELHLHLTGAYPLSYLRTVASEREMETIEKSLSILSKGVPYHEAFKYFAPVEKVINTNKKVEDGVKALCLDLIKDGVVYAEIRTGLKDLGSGYENYLKAVLAGMASCPQKIQTKLLLSLRRSTSIELAKLTVDLAIRYKGNVVGLDISGDSTLGEMSVIVPEVLRAKEAGLFLALHLGESSKEISNDLKQEEQVEVLRILEPHRVGHGVFLSKQAKDWMLGHLPKVALEVCPSSSVLAGMMDHHSNHPGLEYYLQNKHPIVIGTDDPLLFQTTLSAEYRKLLEIDQFSIQDVRTMIEWSFEHAFLDSEEKTRLKAQLESIPKVF